jgi:hypothetical protein
MAARHPRRAVTPTLVWHGPEALRPHLVELGSVEAHPANPRRGNVEAIAASLRAFGQVQPLVVQASTGHVVAGNHRLRAMVELGWTHVAVVKADLSDQDAQRYLVADNRTSDLATNDDQALVAVLRELEDAGALAGTGYDADALEDLQALLGSLETEPEAFTGGYADPEISDPAVGGRTTVAGQHEPLREVKLVLTTSQAQVFGVEVQKLRKAYRTGGVAATVLEAVMRQAAQL